jgi:hypothetical protein
VGCSRSLKAATGESSARRVCTNALVGVPMSVEAGWSFCRQMSEIEPPVGVARGLLAGVAKRRRTLFAEDAEG